MLKAAPASRTQGGNGGAPTGTGGGRGVSGAKPPRETAVVLLWAWLGFSTWVQIDSSPTAKPLVGVNAIWRMDR
jgi:hypothetical protein